MVVIARRRPPARRAVQAGLVVGRSRRPSPGGRAAAGGFWLRHGRCGWRVRTL